MSADIVRREGETHRQALDRQIAEIGATEYVQRRAAQVPSLSKNQLEVVRRMLLSPRPEADQR